ncbi:mRNA turnover and ribosome assembly protein [Dispira simplex]|nr:mRNA turnover and ribosome assembly protein [Dispira simplex]
MPKSKRAKLISLTRTEAKGRDLKVQLIEKVQQSLDNYDYVYVFSVDNMRNTFFKDIRQSWKTSRFFFGKNKVMAKAFGTTPETEYQPNSMLVSQQLTGDVGLLFTNEQPAKVTQFFQNYVKRDFARAGMIATDTISLAEGPVVRGVDQEPLPPNMEPHLRGLGMPTALKTGVVTLMREFDICKAGDVLTSQQAHLMSFSVEYHSNYKIVTDHLSKEEVVLLQCGTPLPDRQLANKRKVIEIPVNRIAVLQNSTASYLKLLGYPEVINVNGSSSAPFLGVDGANGALRKPKDRSRGIKFTAPGEVIGNVDVVFTGHPNTAAKHVSVSEGKEKVPLRSTDWLGYYSLFINQEKRANRLIQDTRANYQCISKRMNELIERHNAPRYRIGWIRVEPQATYNNHTERWIFSIKDYKKILSHDAGGEFLGNSSTHRVTDLQIAQEAMKEVDVVVEETYGMHTLDAVIARYGLEDTSEYALNYPFIHHRLMLRVDGVRTESDGNGWYQSALPRADLVLQDYIRAIYLPHEKEFPRLWFRNIARREKLRFLYPNASLYVINGKNGDGDGKSDDEAISSDPFEPHPCEKYPWDKIERALKTKVSSTSVPIGSFYTWGWSLVTLSALWWVL